jgi:hypothetical protein
MNTWKPAHTPPPDLQPVLVYLPRKHAQSNVHAAFFKNGRPCVVGGVFAHDLPMGADSVTHWMPLPDPPAE